jgi:hypothetical protein|tara:strand:+ start:336 stop:590 length:255 start_codon:yes stop_codon:yes gene_type:complete
MNEYNALVIQEGQTETLKTFGNSVEEAVDNLVMMEGITFLHWIKDVKLQEQWDFDEDLVPLRALRKRIPDYVDMSFGVKHVTTH